MRTLVLFAPLLALGCAGPGRLVDDAADRLADAEDAVAAGEYARALALQREAVAIAERLPSEYPGSQQASVVERGGLQVGPHSLKALRERVIPTSELRVAALTDLAAAAAYLGVASRDDETLLAVTSDLAAASPTAAAVAAGWIREPEHRAQAWLAVAQGTRRPGPPERVTAAVDAAAEAARDVDSVNTRWNLLEVISAAYLPQHRFDLAVATARSIPEPAFQVRALTAAGDTLAAAGRGEEASTVLSEAVDNANILDERADQARAWVRLARVYAEGRAPDGARTLLDRTLKAIPGLPLAVTEPIQAEAAGVYAVLGDHLAALDAMRGIGTEAGRVAAFRQVADAAPTGETLLPVLEAARLLKAHGAGDVQVTLLARFGARAEPAAIVEAAAFIPDPADRARALAAVGQQRRDATLLEAARRAAAEVYRDTERAGVRTRVALAMAGAGMLEPANALLDEATRAALEASSARSRAEGLLAIGRAALEAGQVGAAAPRLEAALTHADAMVDPLASTGLLTDMAALIAKPPAGVALDPGLTSRALEAATARAGSLTYEGPRATALGRIARLLPALGARGAAAANAMLTAAGSIDDPDRRDMLRRRALGALAASGEGARALELAAGDPSSLAEVAPAAAGAGDLSVALAAVEAQPEAGLRARALADVAGAAPSELSAGARAALRRLVATAARD